MHSLPVITAGELAQRVQGKLVGDAQRIIRHVAPLDQAGPDDLSWLGHARYTARLAKSRAGTVLVPANCEVPANCTTIVVPDPDLALTEVLRILAPPMDTVPTGIDPTARVAPDATVTGACVGPHVYVGPRTVIGPGTQLHAGVYVGSDSQIGRDCVVWPNTVVRERCTLGDRVIVHPNVTIGADGFGYLFRDGRHCKIPQIGGVAIGDDVEIGAGTCIDRARSGLTRIGHGTKIDNLVQIGHNAQIGEHVIIVGQCGISGSTSIGDYVVLAGQVGIGDHVRIGDRVSIGARGLSLSDVPDDQELRGSPAVPAREYARQVINVRRLPKLIDQVRTLTKRVQQLESAAND